MSTANRGSVSWHAWEVNPLEDLIVISAAAREGRSSTITKIRGPKRKRIIQRHRTDEYLKIFDKYVDGKASIADVHCRAVKLKELRGKRR